MIMIIDLIMSNRTTNCES